MKNENSQGKFLYVLFVWYNFRERAQYCYENTTTGEIKWEYPAIQNNTSIDDDAMDICTTPPPNENEDLSAAHHQSTGCKKIIHNLI